MLSASAKPMRHIIIGVCSRGGSGGVRITFRRARFRRLIDKIPEIRSQKVIYKLLLDTRESPAKIADLPFLKRHPYEHEDEFRLVYESGTLPQQPVDIDLPVNVIRQVTLSPWMNAKVSDAVKDAVKAIPGCERIHVHRSTLIGNDEWMAYGDQALLCSATK